MDSSKTLFLHEDEPHYKHAVIIPYHHDPESDHLTLWLWKNSSATNSKLGFAPFKCTIKQREPSILFSIARTLIVQTRNFLPWEDPLCIQNIDDAPLFYNPTMTYLLATLLQNDRVVTRIEGDTWTVWYPLDQRLDSRLLNRAYEPFGIECRAF